MFESIQTRTLRSPFSSFQDYIWPEPQLPLCLETTTTRLQSVLFSAICQGYPFQSPPWLALRLTQPATIPRLRSTSGLSIKGTLPNSEPQTSNQVPAHDKHIVTAKKGNEPSQQAVTRSLRYTYCRFLTLRLAPLRIQARCWHLQRKLFDGWRVNKSDKSSCFVPTAVSSRPSPFFHCFLFFTVVSHVSILLKSCSSWWPHGRLASTGV